jgi:hypothetical protein
MMDQYGSKHVGVFFFFLPQQAEVAQGIPGRLRPRIFLTFGTTRVVVRQPYAPAATEMSTRNIFCRLKAAGA